MYKLVAERDNPSDALGGVMLPLRRADREKYAIQLNTAFADFHEATNYALEASKDNDFVWAVEESHWKTVLGLTFYPPTLENRTMFSTLEPLDMVAHPEPYELYILKSETSEIIHYSLRHSAGVLRPYARIVWTRSDLTFFAEDGVTILEDQDSR